MATSVIFNGNTYSIPAAGELNWASLSNFLVALSSVVATTSQQKWGIRVATSSPVTVATLTDCVIVTKLSVAGAVAVNLPAGVSKQIFCIVDGMGDAETNNITIDPNGAETINGASTLVLNSDREGVIIAYSGSEWVILAKFKAAGEITNADISATAAIAYSKLNLATSIVNADVASAAAIAYSKLALSNSIVNADVASAAAIAYSKLNLATSIVNADVASAAAIAYSKLALSNGIVNADINASAAIVDTKLSTITTAGKVSNSATTAASANTASAIVARDGSGNFTAGTITASLTGNASGTAANVTGTVAIANGGTGAATKATAFDALSPMTTAGDLLRGGASGTGTRVAVGVEGQSLRVVSGLPTWADGGSGSGTLNLITNPSAASNATTDVTNGTSHTTARVSGANSPLNTAIPTAFEITASATAVESATSGQYHTFTVPAALRNTKLRVGFSYTVQASQTWSVSVRNATGRLVLNTDASGASILANSTATVTSNFSAAFDSDSDAGNYTVNITRTAGSGTAILYVTNIAVDAGTIINVPAVGARISYTPNASVNQGFGTVGASELMYQRIGDSMLINGYFTPGTVTSAEARLAIPVGLTLGSPLLASTSVGKWVRNLGTGSNAKQGNVLAATGENFLKFSMDDYTASINPFTAQNASAIFTSSQVIGLINVIVPIAEWAGSGTVNLGANDYEVAYNSSGTTTAGASDTSSFGYGWGGAAIGSIASTTVTGNSTTTMRVRFLTPQQKGENVEIYLDTATGQYVRVGLTTGAGNYDLQNAAAYGIGITQISATDFDVKFGNGGRFSTSTFGAAGAAWSGISSWRWVAVKGKINSANGFSLATATQSGLVKGGQVPGTITNDSAIAGNVGEYVISSRIRSASTSISASTDANVLAAALSLTAGEWEIGGSISFNGNSSTNISTIQGSISKTSATLSGANTISVPTSGEVRVYKLNTGVIGTNDESITLPNVRVQISSTTSFYLVAKVDYTVSTLTTYGAIYARRVR